MTKVVKKLRKPIFTDADGNRWKYVGYDRDTFGMTAYYESVGDPGNFHEIDIDFISQEGEHISGWEYPNHESYSIDPGTRGYDYDRAVATALDEAHAILQERIAA